ncbi:MAG: tRNA (adenosine(37)-N6)-threonylcarbamoyltransferase complex dimerization subunit type 1 TsaB [Sphingomicrobium sp.]
MILAFDTSSEACTAALFEADGALIARSDERIGRGHAERLVPMLAEMIGDARPGRILVGIGPGSFTGIRVAVAAAHGLAIGWDAALDGFSSLALLAAAAEADDRAVAVAILGGHGQLFVQQFDGASLKPQGPVESLAPEAAAQAITALRVIGSGAAALVAARGTGEAIDAMPAAATVFRLPKALRTLDPKPVYVRAPDAKAKAAA